ncbi:hypothetical protein CEP63_018315 [Proteus mirabilis]|nr:hypothetical protein CEP63_018315 [Proteus mirabilis]
MDWIIHIITFIAGSGVGWSLRIIYSSRKNVSNRTADSNNRTVNSNNRTVTQNGNNVMNGSIVAGDQDSSH